MNQTYPKIKICGITRQEELDILAENKVDYGGFVLFYPKSKRNLTCDCGAALGAQLKEKLPSAQTVAVVVSPNIEQVKKICRSGFDIIQIHGQLTREVYEQITLPIFRAFNISKENNQQVLNQIESWDKIKGIVLDGEKPGGGQPFEWSRFQDFCKENQLKNQLFILAGGLDADNVVQAIEICHPDIVDISSNVEGEQGKDACKVRKFVQAVKNKNKICSKIK